MTEARVSAAAEPEVRNPHYADAVAEIFTAATFVDQLGIELDGCGPGWCEAAVDLEPRHLQQDGFAHAGLQATIADHTAGGAAATLAEAGARVLSVEFKINMLRPAVGQRLRCRAEVLRAGRRISVVEAWVRCEGAEAGSAARLSAKATVTIAVVPPA